MNVEVFPEIEIEKGYKKITLPKTKVEVKAAEVTSTMEDIQKKFTKFEPAQE